MKTSSTKKQGFTLPEVIITSILVLLMMIPISRIAYTTLISSRYSRDMSSAISVGQEQLEAFSEMPYANITSGSSTNGEFSLSWTVTVQQYAKIVQLTVSWQVLSQTKSIEFNTIYADEIDGGFSIGLII